MRKWVVGLIAAIAVISVGGVGFAAFTSTVTLQINGAAGTLHLQWVGPSSPATVVVPAIPTDTPICNAALTPSTLMLTFKNMAPNDTCSIPVGDAVGLQNTGTLGAALTFTNQAKFFGGFCYYVAFSAIFGITTIGAGATIPSGGLALTFQIFHGDPSCAGSSLEWWLNFTATAGT